MSWWDSLESQPCPLKDVCDTKDKDGCTPTCSAYYCSRIMFKYSGLPKIGYEHVKLKPENVDVEAYRICNDYKENIFDYVSKGRGIYIYSKNKGNGKTQWAFKFVKEYIRQACLKGYIDEKMVYYVNISEMFEYLRMNMEDKAKLKVVENRVLNADLVVFDDLGVEAPTEWVKNKLYNYINYRYNNKKAMVFTSNFTYVDVSKRISDRIMDRISEVCRPVEFKGVSRRRMNVWWKQDD